MDEIIVFLMREFGWEYEYTRDLVKSLPIAQLNALIEETQFQKSVDDYRQASYSAMIVVALVSSPKHRKRVTDIIGRPPQRKGGPTLEQVAKKKGIKLPEGGKDGK